MSSMRRHALMAVGGRIEKARGDSSPCSSDLLSQVEAFVVKAGTEGGSGPPAAKFRGCGCPHADAKDDNDAFHSPPFADVEHSLHLTACASTLDRLEHIGQAPPLSPIAVPPTWPPCCRLSAAAAADASRARQIRCGGRLPRSFFRDPRHKKSRHLDRIHRIGDQAKDRQYTSRSTKASETLACRTS